jgi:hypothetical protein
VALHACPLPRLLPLSFASGSVQESVGVFSHDLHSCADRRRFERGRETRPSRVIAHGDRPTGTYSLEAVELSFAERRNISECIRRHAARLCGFAVISCPHRSDTPKDRARDCARRSIRPKRATIQSEGTGCRWIVAVRCRYGWPRRRFRVVGCPTAAILGHVRTSRAGSRDRRRRGRCDADDPQDGSRERRGEPLLPRCPSLAI